MLIHPREKLALRELCNHLMGLDRGPLQRWLETERERLREMNEREQDSVKLRQTQGGLRVITALLKAVQSARETLKAFE